jgi:ParB family chromosome partitioning protein
MASLIPVSFLKIRLPDGPGWQRKGLTTSEPVPLQEINIRDISPNEEKGHWRAPHTDHCQRLAESIKEVGLVNPILVRRLPHGKYAVICGFARVGAMMMLQRKTIMAHITNMNDFQAAVHQYHESRPCHPLNTRNT